MNIIPKDGEVRTLAMLLCDGFEEIEAFTAVDLLRRIGVKVVTLGGGAEVVGAHGIRVGADAVFEGDVCGELFDAVAVPGGMGGVNNVLGRGDMVGFVARHAREGRVTAAICAGPLVLNRADLDYGTSILGSGRFTCHPGVRDMFAPRFGVSDILGVASCVCGRTVTGRSPGCAADWAYAISQVLGGRSTELVAEYNADRDLRCLRVGASTPDGV